LAGCRKRRLAKYYVYGEVSAAAVIAVISDINNERIITAIAIIEATNIFELILCFVVVIIISFFQFSLRPTQRHNYRSNHLPILRVDFRMRSL
jgi:hypothetical protein